MTLHQFFADPGSLDDAVVGDRLVLRGSEGRHAVTVKRIQPGESILVADGAGVRATGMVLTAAGGELELSVADVCRVPAPVTTFALVQGLAKGDRDELAVEASTELGVDRVIPWQSERSIVQWKGERAEKSRRKWADTVRAAAKQSRRAWIPPVEEVVTTAQLVSRCRRATASFILHEEASACLAAQPIPAAGEVLVVVGPEGGISPAELAALTGAGGIPVKLGDQVLRSSTAGPAALAVLSAADRWQ
ncbi:MAG: 16S rRNA (uracil(1498)-N(3))-methyltransferase [Dermatophilaceae bacterium]